MASPGSVQKSEEEWRAILSPEQFRILRLKGTELRGTGEYDKFFGEGIYECAGCGTPLYKSTTKFDSGCGWPAFYEGLPGTINRSPDLDGRRIEITCAACGGHLGHVFKGEGFNTPTDERHCVNSISVNYPDPRDACSAIAAESYKIWLEHEDWTDDITIIVVHIKDLCNSDAVATNEESHTGTEGSLMVSQKVRTERSAFPGSEICHKKRGSFLELHSCPPDFPLERNLACVAPSPTHSLSVET